MVKQLDEREVQIKEVSGWWNFDRNPKKWDKDYDESDIHNRSYLLLRQATVLDYVDQLNLPKGAKVLELGYGAGQTALALGKKGLEVYGLDISEGFAKVATQRCEKNCPEGKFFLKAGNIEDNYEFADETFDVVVVVGALQYLYDPQACLKEVHRVLKKGGHFIVAQRNIYSLSNFTSVRDFFRSVVHFCLREKYELFSSFKSMLVESKFGYFFKRFENSTFLNTEFMLKRHDVLKYKIKKRLYSYFSLKSVLKKSSFAIKNYDGSYYCFSENKRYYNFNVIFDRWIKKIADKKIIPWLFTLGRTVVLSAQKQ